jgi:sigma-B regulation protein RsbU (phosphoserine phosphatase)
MRATALQLSHPGQVLERVNDLLVPDAPQGMFVTLAYAVLNLETGELEYANAGHNPPLLLRNQTCDLRPFERTGMALGVLEGNRIEGRRIHLESEDFVIMYTDGVTESFSPEGEIFGENRLFETILETVNSDPEHIVDAQTLLERIDWAVSDFVDEAAASDDLTLVILKCTSP